MIRTPIAVLPVLLCAAAPLGGVVLDRIAVTVGQQVITASEIVTDLRVSAFLDRKPVDFSPKARRDDAGRLVDQILILQEAGDSHFVLPTEADAAREVEMLKPLFGGEQEYLAALTMYRISEADLVAHLLAGLRALAFTELRFRPEVAISDQDLRAEYDKLAAQARETKAALPDFEASRGQLEQLVANEREMQALDQWLIMTRRERDVQYREEAFQ